VGPGGAGAGGAGADGRGAGSGAAGGAVDTTGVSTRLGQPPRNRPTAPAATMTATHRDVRGMDALCPDPRVPADGQILSGHASGRQHDNCNGAEENHHERDRGREPNRIPKFPPIAPHAIIPTTATNWPISAIQTVRWSKPPSSFAIARCTGGATVPGSRRAQQPDASSGGDAGHTRLSNHRSTRQPARPRRAKPAQRIRSPRL
jgi:hypothetical protein